MRERRLLALAGAALAAALVLLAACAPSSVPPMPEAGPEITFWADQEVVPPGGCTMLHWDVVSSGEVPVFLQGRPVDPFGDEEICVGEPTTFELIVEAPEGPIGQAITIQVEGEFEGPPPEEPGPGEPPPEGPGPEGELERVMFVVDPDVIPQGECALLHWEVAPSDLPWPVFINGQEVPSNGERMECPEGTTTYELFIEVPGGPEQRTATLHVEGGGPGPEPTPPQSAPPPPTAATSAPTPPAQPTATQQPSAPTGVTADVRPSDLYPDKQPKGVIWVRVVNDGPGTLSNKRVRISGSVTRGTKTAIPSASGNNLGPQEFTINLAPGQQQNINLGLGWDIDLNQYDYEFTVKVEAVDFTDPKGGNNSYKESFKAAAPPAQGDLVLEDAFMSADGTQLILRVANSPSGSLSGSFGYQVVATTTSVIVKSGSFTIPTGSQAFWTGYKPSSGVGLKITIDPDNKISETNENNNSMTKTF